jgi:hypothetical protein
MLTENPPGRALPTCTVTPLSSSAATSPICLPYADALGSIAAGNTADTIGLASSIHVVAVAVIFSLYFVQHMYVRLLVEMRMLLTIVVQEAPQALQP